MRIACVHIAGLAAQAAVIDNPQLRGQPVIIGGSSFDDAPVHDASPEAIACGVAAGMRLRQAYGLYPQAVFLPRNEYLCKALFGAVLDILDGFSPAVEIEADNCVCLDLTGVKNERDTAGSILHDIVIGTGLRASLGLSSGKFFSRTAAITAEPGAIVVIGCGQEKDFIAPYPVDLLPCPVAVRYRLSLLGLCRIGQLAEFSAGDLTAQFGSDGKTMHGLACGRDRSTLVPRARPDVIADSIELCPPAVSSTEIVQSCQLMLNNLLPSMESRGRLCGEAILRLCFELGQPQEIRLIFKEAAISEPVIMKRIKACVENMSFPSPAAGVELRLMLTGETGRKLQLWREVRDSREAMGKMTEALRARFGYQPLKKVEVVDPGAIFPERRTRLVELNEGE
jgi:DNA polymerase-4